MWIFGLFSPLSVGVGHEMRQFCTPPCKHTSNQACIWYSLTAQHFLQIKPINNVNIFCIKMYTSPHPRALLGAVQQWSSGAVEPAHLPPQPMNGRCRGSAGCRSSWCQACDRSLLAPQGPYMRSLATSTIWSNLTRAAGPWDTARQAASTRKGIKVTTPSRAKRRLF